MDLEEALLQAIQEAPADEAPWLVLADWLDDQGQPERAELLRLSRPLHAGPEGDQRRACEQRVRELLLAGVVPCVPALTNSLGMRLVLIPAGTFLMGSPTDEAD